MTVRDLGVQDNKGEKAWIESDEIPPIPKMTKTAMRLAGKVAHYSFITDVPPNRQVRSHHLSFQRSFV